MHTQYEFHPIANCFPLMDDFELEELAADIKANGQEEDIWLYQHMILDGRNRYRACNIAGVLPRTRNFAAKDEEDAVAFAISHNLKRKQYSPSQLAIAAEELTTYKKGDNRFTMAKVEPIVDAYTCASTPKPKPPMSQGDAAKKLGVSRRLVQKAAAVKKADPELAKEVKTGKVTLEKAEKVIEIKKADPELAQEFKEGKVKFKEAVKKVRAPEQGVVIYRKISVSELVEKLTPIIEVLKAEQSIHAITLRQLLDGWTGKPFSLAAE